MTTPVISLLVAARCDSKFLMKFRHTLEATIADRKNTELLLCHHKTDTWNEPILNQKYWDELLPEDSGAGRSGLHVYFNLLAMIAKGDWLMYACEDHHFILDSWDDYIRDEVTARKLDPKKPYILVPTWDNTGSVSHIVSRGWIDTLGYIGDNGWIDSYLNYVSEHIPQDRVIKLEKPMLHDFTADLPQPLIDQDPKPLVTNPMVLFSDESVPFKIKRDGNRITKAIQGGQ